MADTVYSLKSVASWHYLHSEPDGTIKACEPCWTSCQKWIRREVGGGGFALDNLATGFRLSAAGQGNVCAIPENRKRNDDQDQQWVFERGPRPLVVRNVRTQELLHSDRERVYTRPSDWGRDQDWEIAEIQDARVEFTEESLTQAVRSLFEGKGYLVSGPFRAGGGTIDLVAEAVGSYSRPIYIETTAKYLDVDDRNFSKFYEEAGLISAQSGQFGKKLLISSKGFSPRALAHLNADGVHALTYEQLPERLWALRI